MYCFVILLLFNEMQMSVRRFSAIPHLRVKKQATFRRYSTPLSSQKGDSYNKNI